MSDDMRLLILTHLRAAMERKDWRQVEKARQLCLSNRDGMNAQRLLQAMDTRSRAAAWAFVEGAYAAMGGVGCGEPGKSPGDPEKARDGASEGAAA